jgi:hypothetical protein
MVTIASLWLPIIVSAVFVFIMSMLVHMVFKYRANDFRKFPDEDAVADALRKLNIPDGEYALPKAADMKEFGTSEFQEKVKKGPNLMMTIWGGSSPSMSKELTLWFLYVVVVGIFSAYVAGRALEPGAPYLSVFRFAGVTAFACYSMAEIQRSIWWRQSWSKTFKALFDGLLYALLTGGTFGWLWPDM